MGTHFKGSEAERRALDAYIKLVRATESLMSSVNRGLAEPGLTPSQFGALEALLHLGPLSPGELGRKLLKSGGNITLVVDNLEKRGLVRRERQSGDRRCVTVHLTEAGDELIRRIFPGHVASIVEALGGLSASEQEELGRLCRRLGRAAAGPASEKHPITDRENQE